MLGAIRNGCFASMRCVQELEVGGSAEDLTSEGRAALDTALAGNPTLRKLKFFDDPSCYFVRS